MRQIVLDTETTGMSAAAGHRIIEIGAVEIVNRRVTERVFHRYLNPERAIDAGATAVHGMRAEDLKDEPTFDAIVEPLLEFVRDSEVIIHNADFDVGFLDAELARAGVVKPRLTEYCQILDSLTLARELHPGLRNSLDALCRRYDVDNSGRDLHGALLDANLLARVYLAMTGGQASLSLTQAEPAASESGQVAACAADNLERARVACVIVGAEENAAHEQLLAKIAEASGRPSLWHTQVVKQD
ncbi:MAG: DNA polymerase III subunit epsilon [Pseudomonadota bacterium]